MQYPFKIYSSSAGSGKTYTLTKEYLKLALQQDNPGYYKQILAITFTNDAASEMKERIMSALKGFADEESLPENKKVANRQLLQTIVQELNQYNDGEPVIASDIRKRAARTFRSILHDYSDFAVSTIDSFVNRLVSAFTEELNIPFNYEVDLDAADLLNNAIDRLLNRVGDTEEILLSDMLESFAMEKADEGKSWNYLPGDLAGFGMHLLNERVFEAVGKLHQVNLKDFRELRSEMNGYIELIKGQVSSLADEALEQIASLGLDSKSFAGGSNGIHGYFSKIVEEVESRITWAPTDAFVRGISGEDWAPKAVKDAVRSKVNGLAGTLMEYYETIERLKGEYILIQAILRHFYKLSVIHEINTELTAIKAEKNVVHISDFNKAIINIVLQEPVPFIYERLGERYNHIMIDEFQDTSVLQWNNLLPLIENSVAKGHFSMIVGDAKQAIYGWRGGDMEQIVYLSQKRFGELALKHLQTELLEHRYETLQYSLSAERLSTNYRSTVEIISFNNELFRLLTQLHRQDKKLLTDVYDAFFEQQTPVEPRMGGHIQIDFIDKNNDMFVIPENDPASPYQRNTFQALLGIIAQARKDGYAYRDMAILNRGNVAGKAVANFLKEQSIEVISQDSLLLRSAASVTLLIAIFQVIHQPELTLNRYEALHLFHTYILKSLPDASSDEVKQVLTSTDNKHFYDYLAKRGYRLDPFKIQQAGIYELTEKVIQVFSLFDQPKQATYLFRFLDVILEFSIKQSDHLADFMEFWDEKKDKLCINTPKDWDAVTVTSIHKAKGLEYPVVIVPFADWDFSHKKDDLLWVSLDTEDLIQPTYLLQNLSIRSAAISPVKDLNRTPLQGQYSQESEKIFIENLNTLYVALTRPIDRLYLLAKKDEFEKKTDNPRINVSYLLYQYLEHINIWEPERNTYIIHEGTKKTTIDIEESADNIVWLDNAIYADWQEKARLSRKASTVFDLETFDLNQDLPHKLCYALSNLPHIDKLDIVLSDMQAEGLLEIQEMPGMQQAIQVILSQEILQPYFAKNARTIASRDIISKKALALQAPDRVVITGNTVSILTFISHSPKEADKRGLNRYAQFLSEMGYTSIEKLLICTTDNSITKWI